MAQIKSDIWPLSSLSLSKPLSLSYNVVKNVLSISNFMFAHNADGSLVDSDKCLSPFYYPSNKFHITLSRKLIGILNDVLKKWQICSYI